MPPERAATLTNYLLDRTGDALRGVVYYDDDSDVVYYLREDVQESDVQTCIEEVLDNVVTGAGGPDDAIAEEFGSLTASVHLHEKGVLVHLPKAEEDDGESGVLLAFESTVARQLDDFQGECVRRM